MYLFRITQELIHNALNHSSAWHIKVRLRWEPEVLTLEVEDDGTGFAKVGEFIKRLKEKHNSLKMRSNAIGASIDYKGVSKGLLAIVKLGMEPRPAPEQ